MRRLLDLQRRLPLAQTVALVAIFVYGAATTSYALNANMNAGSGSPYVNSTTGNQLGRIDIAVAPSNPNYIYAQVQSITPNNNTGCGVPPVPPNPL